MAQFFSESSNIEYHFILLMMDKDLIILNFSIKQRILKNLMALPKQFCKELRNMDSNITKHDIDLCRKILEEAEKYGIKKEDIISFSANVNPLGISPLLREGIAKHIETCLYLFL